QFLPQRPHPPNAECMTPHGTVLHQALNFDDFIPPIPPPPYYPPEYTCTPGREAHRGLHLDFPPSPFGALYEVTINSPGMLYPSELPPPYEAVIGEVPATQNCAHGRSLDCSSGHYSPSARELQSSARESNATPPLKQKKSCCVGFSQPSVPFQSSPCFGPANTSSCMRGHKSAIQQHRPGKHPIATLVRSHSAPVPGSSGTGVAVSGSHMAASACQHSLGSFLPPENQRDTRRLELHLKPKAFHTVSKERPHSLVDLKAYKDTKILVAKFLEHSNCNLPPEVWHVVNSIRSVIKSDERHMEEAIFSANIIDQ
ncbi:F1891 protein, partial [Xiphorhynchus elegans]|nr:F1891 protein [Xiphorhynchus elegans]